LRESTERGRSPSVKLVEGLIVPRALSAKKQRPVGGKETWPIEYVNEYAKS